MSKSRTKYKTGGYVAEGKHKNKGSLVYQLEQRMKAMLEPGRSKHQDKLANHGKPRMNKYYAYSTCKNYLRTQNMFVRDVRSIVSGLKTIEAYRPYVEAWIEARIEAGLAPSTIHTNTAALAKLYTCHMDDFDVARPKRAMTNFTKNRTETWKKYYTPEQHPDLEVTCHGAGLRLCELKRVAPQQVKRRADNSVYILAVKGKGGKIRDVDVLEECWEMVWGMAQEALANGREHLLRMPPRCAPTHQHRGWYARELYRRCERPFETLPRKELYHSRVMGVAYDRAAMQVVSEMLGHCRLSVVINYFQAEVGKDDEKEKANLHRIIRECEDSNRH